MKKFTVIAVLFFVSLTFVQAQYATKLFPTSKSFENGELVYDVIHKNQKVGEFWPATKRIELVTRENSPELFSAGIDTILNKKSGVAIVPGGMTGGAAGSYQMLGRNLSHGKPCGDGNLYRYGIICLNANGDSIGFTHKDEISNFDSLYRTYKKNGGTILFLPSIFRIYQDTIHFRSSDNLVDKVLIRRDTPDGPQIGVIVFNELVTYDKAKDIILGLDRPGKSRTTHIYFLDGGPSWGQSCKKVNGHIEVIGTRDADVVTNYLVIK